MEEGYNLQIMIKVIHYKRKDYSFDKYLWLS